MTSLSIYVFSNYEKNSFYHIAHSFTEGVKFGVEEWTSWPGA